MAILHVGTPHLSSWSLRAYLALAHSGAPFDVNVIELDQPDSRANILRVSPTGRVPCLHDGDLVIQDSLAICEYIAEANPQLWPADRAARARARAISAEMHSGFSALRTNMPMNIGASLAGQGRTPEVLADAARVMQIWRECLSSGGPFLFGDFSIADCMFAPVTTRFTTYAVPMADTARAYSETIAALPALRTWLTLRPPPAPAA